MTHRLSIGEDRSFSYTLEKEDSEIIYTGSSLALSLSFPLSNAHYHLLTPTLSKMITQIICNFLSHMHTLVGSVIITPLHSSSHAEKKAGEEEKGGECVWSVKMEVEEKSVLRVGRAPTFNNVNTFWEVLSLFLDYFHMTQQILSIFLLFHTHFLCVGCVEENTARKHIHPPWGCAASSN